MSEYVTVLHWHMSEASMLLGPWYSYPGIRGVTVNAEKRRLSKNCAHKVGTSTHSRHDMLPAAALRLHTDFDRESSTSESNPSAH